MKIQKILKFEETLKSSGSTLQPHYWHTSLPAEFIARAGHIFERLQGIDNWVDKTSKEKWVDEFRTEVDYESALQIYIECLAALAKFKRKVGKVTGLNRKALYYLALTRSGCEAAEEAFRIVQTHCGFSFADREKKYLMRVIDSCVCYRPMICVADVPALGLN